MLRSFSDLFNMNFNVFESHFSSFIPRFISYIYKCKPISTIGAEQVFNLAFRIASLILIIPSHNLPPVNSTSIPYFSPYKPSVLCVCKADLLDLLVRGWLFRGGGLYTEESMR